MHIPLWAGRMSAGTVLNDATGRVAYSMLKCHTVCAHPVILICCTPTGTGMYVDRLLAFSLMVCLPPFLLVLLLPSSLKAFPEPSTYLR